MVIGCLKIGIRDRLMQHLWKFMLLHVGLKDKMAWTKSRDAARLFLPPQVGKLKLLGEYEVCITIIATFLTIMASLVVAVSQLWIVTFQRRVVVTMSPEGIKQIMTRGFKKNYSNIWSLLLIHFLEFLLIYPPPPFFNTITTQKLSNR